MCWFQIDPSLKWLAQADMSSGLAGIECQLQDVSDQQQLPTVTVKSILETLKWLSRL